VQALLGSGDAGSVKTCADLWAYPNKQDGWTIKSVSKEEDNSSDTSTAPSTPRPRSRHPGTPVFPKNSRLCVQPCHEPLQTDETDSTDILPTNANDMKRDCSDRGAAANLTWSCSCQQASITPRRFIKLASLVDQEPHKLGPGLNMAPFRANLDPVPPAYQKHMLHKGPKNQLSPVVHEFKSRGVLSCANGAKHADVGRAVACPTPERPEIAGPAVRRSPRAAQRLGTSVTKHSKTLEAVHVGVVGSPMKSLRSRPARASI